MLKNTKDVLKVKPDSSVATITRSEWLKAFGEAEIPELEGGQTIQEIAEEIGLSRCATEERVKKLLAAGQALKGRRKHTRGWISTYKLKGGKK